MATPAQRDAYRRVINLILEEIEGCELKPDAPETVELMDIVREMEGRIIAGPYALPSQPAKPTFAHKPKGKSNQSRMNFQSKPKARKWQTGPLASTAASPTPKPLWFTDA